MFAGFVAVTALVIVASLTAPAWIVGATAVALGGLIFAGFSQPIWEQRKQDIANQEVTSTETYLKTGVAIGTRVVAEAALFSLCSTVILGTIPGLLATGFVASAAGSVIQQGIQKGKIDWKQVVWEGDQGLIFAGVGYKIFKSLSPIIGKYLVPKLEKLFASMAEKGFRMYKESFPRILGQCLYCN